MPAKQFFYSPCSIENELYSDKIRYKYFQFKPCCEIKSKTEKNLQTSNWFINSEATNFFRVKENTNTAQKQTNEKTKHK